MYFQSLDSPLIELSRITNIYHWGPSPLPGIGIMQPYTLISLTRKRPPLKFATTIASRWESQHWGCRESGSKEQASALMAGSRVGTKPPFKERGVPRALENLGFSLKTQPTALRNIFLLVLCP